MNSILITGASRGIGKATAELFLKKGWHVFGTSTSGTCDIKNKEFEIYQLDLSISASIENFKKQFGENKIDVLLNNAGIGLDEMSAPPVDLNVLRQDLEVNLFGTITITEALVGNINNNGKIINTSSQMAAFDQEFSYSDPSYRISKAALNMFTLNLAKDTRLIEKGIVVCSFDPGWVQTDMGGPDATRKPDEPAAELYTLSNKGFSTGVFYKGLEVRSW